MDNEDKKKLYIFISKYIDYKLVYFYLYVLCSRLYSNPNCYRALVH